MAINLKFKIQNLSNESFAKQIKAIKNGQTTICNVIKANPKNKVANTRKWAQNFNKNLNKIFKNKKIKITHDTENKILFIEDLESNKKSKVDVSFIKPQKEAIKKYVEYLNSLNFFRYHEMLNAKKALKEQGYDLSKIEDYDYLSNTLTYDNKQIDLDLTNIDELNKKMRTFSKSNILE